MKLVNPSDQELNNAFAEYIAGYTDIRHEEGEDCDIDSRTIYPWEGMRGTTPEGKRQMISRYTEWVHSVLPWMEKDGHYWSIAHRHTWNEGERGYIISVYENEENGKCLAPHLETPILARGLVIQMLRASGIKVEFTKEI